MDRRKLILLFHTLKYLKPKQVYYRVFYLIRNKLFKHRTHKRLGGHVPQIKWCLNEIFFHDSYSNDTFTFLNRSKRFEEKINWNFSGYGKLWTYNLNYFDFLNQKGITKEEGVYLIKDYISKDNLLKDGHEPYPISLRGINWIKFLSKNHIKEEIIDQILFYHYQLLQKNIEYHLLANHLLENGFSLFFGAYYFQDEILYKKATKILKEELKEQILNDGGHFELSPMYHQILLHRLLDCISLIKQNNWKKNQLLSFLTDKASLMLSWLSTITFKDGTIPMVNDSTYDIAPKSSQLFEYAKSLQLKWNNKVKLSDSGYRKYNIKTYECLVDVGDIKPSYQPGHSHSDTFNFVLYDKKRPLIVDTGISTYEKNQLRQKERSTASHNTVQIGELEQSEVWGGFRVGKRAKVVSLEESDTMLKYAHDGYKKTGIVHERTFYMTPKSIVINDILSKHTNLTQKAYFHFHPNINNIFIENHSVKIENMFKIDFKGSIDIKLLRYQYALGFNKTKEAIKIVVYFDQTLETQIHL